MDMTKSRLVALGAVLAALGAAAPAHAAWHVSTLTNSETFFRAIDARPDRVPVVLDERVSGGVSRLELRVGRNAPKTMASGVRARDDAGDRRRPAVLGRRRPRRMRRRRLDEGRRPADRSRRGARRLRARAGGHAAAHAGRRGPVRRRRPPGGDPDRPRRLRHAHAPDPNGGRGAGARVDAFDWAPGAPAPGPVTTISQAPIAGAPALVARAEIVFVVWTETNAANQGPHTMRVARFGPAGLAPSTTYTNSDHNLGYVSGIPVLQALPGTAVRVYYRPSRSARAYTVTFDENGRARGAALVAERTNADLAGALARDGSLLAWTRKLGTTNASYRVQTASR